MINERDWNIIKHRGNGLTYSEIGDTFNITRERVFQVCKKYGVTAVCFICKGIMDVKEKASRICSTCAPEYFKKYHKSYIKNYRLKPQEIIKERARMLLRQAVENGEVLKSPCVVCGDSRSQGHHEDYSKPLDVVWLCQIHHKKHHKLYPQQGS